MEMTATSLVPPPTSMTIRPTGSPMATQAPMAAAIGSSMSCTRRAPAEERRLLDRAALHLGDARGRAHDEPRVGAAAIEDLLHEVAQHLLGDLEVRDNAVARGRVAEISAGVRPIIRCASAPPATTSPVRSSIATTDGSESTMPRPCTWTTVLAVPRSTAMSRADRSTISDKGARRAGELGRCRLRTELPAVLPQRLVLAQREQDPVLGGVVPDVDAGVDDAPQALEHADRRARVDAVAEDLA